MRGVTAAPLFAWRPDLFFRGLVLSVRALEPQPQTLLRAHFCVCRRLSVWFGAAASASACLSPHFQESLC